MSEQNVPTNGIPNNGAFVLKLYFNSGYCDIMIRTEISILSLTIVSEWYVMNNGVMNNGTFSQMLYFTSKYCEKTGRTKIYI